MGLPPHPTQPSTLFPPGFDNMFRASATALALLLVATTCANTQSTGAASWPPANIKLCYVNFLDVDDLGYSFSFNAARLKIHDNIKTMFPNSTVQSVIAPNAFIMSLDQQKAMLRKHVQRGCHVVVSDAEPLLHKGNYSEVSAMYPNVTFFTNTQPDRELFRGD